MTREDTRWRYLGVFAQELHFTPRDVEALTVEEFDYFVSYVNDLKKRAEAAEKQAAPKH